MDLTVIMGLVALYVAYRIGRWAERTDTAQAIRETQAAGMADLYDSAVRKSLEDQCKQRPPR